MKKYIFLLSLFWATTTFISAQNITRLEYSIDGFVAEGKGTALEVPVNITEMDTEFNIDISGLEPGNHTIHFRAMNDEGVWSFAAERSFYIPEEPITEGIVALEYSINKVVKEGGGNMIALQNGTNQLDSIIIFDVAGLQPGIHNIYMRAKNKLSVWSLPTQRTFVISEPDTAKIENIFYRIYNDVFESVWMSSPVDPSRKNVDSTIMVSVAGMEFGNNYTVEFYAQNSKGVRGYSAFLSGFTMRANNAPVAQKEVLDITISINQLLRISMDSLFTDDDLVFGDSLMYMVANPEDNNLWDFSEWETGSTLSLSPGVDYKGNYTFWLKTMDLAGESDSLQVMLTVTGTTGIGELTANTKFSIYPNPARDYLTIKVKDIFVNGYNMMLFNTTGQLLNISHVIESEHRLDLRKYSGGVYFIVLQNDEFSIRKTVVVE